VVESDINAIALTLKLASLSTAILLLIGPLIAWWLAKKTTAPRVFIESIVALPLVLPPTVLGFYLLILFSPSNPFGGWYLNLTGEPLTFSFIGLVFASVLYSLPFVVQPLQAAFKQFDHSLLEQAKLLKLSVVKTFFHIVLPLTLPSFVIATLLAFAHTVGEFGVVLMIGGNIPGETRVLSIALFDHVESLNYEAAHSLALGLLAFSTVVLILVYGWSSNRVKAIKCI
jgi:molybdate transport system permease protein